MLKVITGLILAYWSWQDIRQKSVSILSLGLGGSCLIAFSVAAKGLLVFHPARMLPGCFLLLLSLFPGRVIGAADGIIFLLLGITDGWEMLLRISFYSLLCFCLYAAFLLICKKVTPKSKLPFLPFVWIGYLAASWEVYLC